MSSIIDVKFTILDIRNGKLWNGIFEKKNLDLFYVYLRECLLQLYYFLYTLNQFCKPLKKKQLLVSTWKGNMHTALVTLDDIATSILYKLI